VTALERFGVPAIEERHDKTDDDRRDAQRRDRADQIRHVDEEHIVAARRDEGADLVAERQGGGWSRGGSSRSVIGCSRSAHVVTKPRRAGDATCDGSMPIA
jgi:hypothetical protein